MFKLIYFFLMLSLLAACSTTPDSTAVIERANSTIVHNTTHLVESTNEFIYDAQLSSDSYINYKLTDRIEIFKALYERHFQIALTTLKSKENYVVEDSKQLIQNILNYQQILLDSFSRLWDNGGIKGTIFADPSKRKKAIKELTMEMQDHCHLQRMDETVWQHIFHQKNTTVINSLFVNAENTARFIESVVINYILRHQFFDCSYEPPLSFFTSLPDTLVLNQTYKTNLQLGRHVDHFKYDIQINQVSLNEKNRYQYQPTQIGKQQYEIAIQLIPSYLLKDSPFHLSKICTYEVVQ